jgi:hypothetical protein
VGVIRAKRLLRNRQGAPLQRLGLREAALSPVQNGEVVEDGDDVGVVRAE